jgi:tRNA dimethylallyltransferase
MAIRVEPKPPVALIAGPTASGKSALALTFAERNNGVIVNADSAQHYRDIPVLSAAPTADELSRVEHRLYGALDGAAPCSAADWAAMAKLEIADIHGSGRLPVLVGGTGLYLRTLLDGIAPIPAIDSEIREAVRSTSVENNLSQLEHVDPEAVGRLNPGDTTRIARALEVVLSTGNSLAQWQGRREGGIADEIDLRPVILLPPRDWLYRRCDQRFDAMIENGAVEEVSRLLSRDLSPDLPIMRAIGVPEIAGCVRGSMSIEEAATAGKQATRRYAKRQYTWFSHQPPSAWPHFTDALEDDAVASALALIEPKD